MASTPEEDASVLRTLTALRAAFIAKFGREPASGDPLVFDPDADTPTPPPPPPGFKRDIAVAMTTAKIPAQIIYAYERTGMLVSDKSAQTMDPQKLARYRAALDEYLAIEYWKTVR